MWTKQTAATGSWTKQTASSNSWTRASSIESSWDVAYKDKSGKRANGEYRANGEAFANEQKSNWSDTNNQTGAWTPI